MTPRTLPRGWTTLTKLAMLVGTVLAVTLVLPGPELAGAAPAPVSAAPAPSASSATPAPTEEASARFRRGVELYGDGDFRAALIEFKRAYEIVPSYQVLYNLGQASAELQDYVSALQSFEQYLAEGGTEIEPARRAEVQAEIEKLRPRVARLLVKVNEDAADILVDDLLRGHSPLDAPLLVSAGRRKVAIAKKDYVPIQRFVDLAGGDEVTLELALSPLTPAAADPSGGGTRRPRDADRGEEDATNTGLWVSLGLTVALGAATGIVGGLALAADGSYADELNTFPSSRERLDDARSKVETLALTADVLGAAAGGAAIVTILFAVFGGADEDETEDPSTSGSARGAGANLLAGPDGVALVGHF